MQDSVHRRSQCPGLFLAEVDSLIRLHAACKTRSRNAVRVAWYEESSCPHNPRSAK